MAKSDEDRLLGSKPTFSLGIKRKVPAGAVSIASATTISAAVVDLSLAYSYSCMFCIVHVYKF